MSREAFVLNYTKQNAYRSSNYPELTVRNATQQDDPALTQLFTEVLDTPFVSIRLERESYLTAAALNYTRSEPKVIVSTHHPQQIWGMFNIGWKYCYINDKSDVQRYLADIRVHVDAQINEILDVIAEYLEGYLSDDILFQSVLLKNQKIYQSDFYKGRKGIPHAYRYDNLYCYAISEVDPPEYPNRFEFKPFDHELVGQVHHFFKMMAKFYNFLPQYDFAGLMQRNHPFWLALSFEDFFVVYEHNEIVGFYGLWDQRKIKKMSVVKYASWLKYFRPFYNLYANILGKMSLPSAAQHLDCLMMHSVLCHPQHVDAFAAIMHHASRQTKRRRLNAFCIGLASNDPRMTKIEETCAYKVAAKHIFHSFHVHPRQVFDRQKVSFFEIGRL